MKNLDILIAGGGIAGLSLCNALGKNHNITLVEKAHQLRSNGTGILLNINAMDVLGKMGLGDEVKKRGTPLVNFSIINTAGKVLSTMTTSTHIQNQGLEMVSINRSELHNALASRCNGSDLLLDTRIESLKQIDNKVQVKLSNNEQRLVDLVIGADGANSKTREMIGDAVQLRYSGYTCWRCLVHQNPEIDRPVEIWGLGKRLGIVPLGNNETYIFLVKNARHEPNQSSQISITDLLPQFSEFQAITGDLFTRLKTPTRVVHDNLYDMPTPFFGEQAIILVGDAAHAMTPNMGQGAGMAIEDAYLLSKIIDNASNIEHVLPQFKKQRYQRVSKFTDSSYKLGKLAQTESRLVAALRNFLFSMTPDRLNNHYMEKLLLNY